MDDVKHPVAEPSAAHAGSARPRGPRVLLLCSSGRAGTTRAMRALGAHPRILIRDVFPYETRVFQYFFLARSARGRHCFGPHSCEGVEYRPGQPGDALADEWIRKHPAGFARPEVGWHSFYEATAKAQHHQAPQWIAEKAIGLELPQRVLESVPHSRLLFVLRDPRDTFLSMNAFNQKAEHSEGFGAERGREAMFQAIIDFHNGFLRLKAQGHAVMAVRYEALVRRPAETAGRLFKWLGLGEADAPRRAAVAAMKDRTDAVEAHSTSASSDKSIGRWRREATAADRGLFAQFHAELVRLGYVAQPAAGGAS